MDQAERDQLELIKLASQVSRLAAEVSDDTENGGSPPMSTLEEIRAALLSILPDLA